MLLQQNAVANLQNRISLQVFACIKRGTAKVCHAPPHLFSSKNTPTTQFAVSFGQTVEVVH